MLKFISQYTLIFNPLNRLIYHNGKAYRKAKACTTRYQPNYNAYKNNIRHTQKPVIYKTTCIQITLTTKQNTITGYINGHKLSEKEVPEGYNIAIRA